MPELLVVIVLIGVLAAISPPIFSNGVSAAEHRARWRAALRRRLRFARSEAVANRTNVGVEFNLQDRTFQLPDGKRKGKWPENIAPRTDDHGRRDSG